MPAREALDQGEHVLGNVAGLGLSVHLRRQVIGRIAEPLGGDGADEEVEVIDHLLGEPSLAAFEGIQARHQGAFRIT